MKQTVDWHRHWESDKPGFHEGQVNAYLQQYLSLFKLQPGDTLFMPLCGKAVDMLWLSQQGYKVIGVELSKVAVESFFAESGLSYAIEQQGPFTVYQSDDIRLYQGDFMDLQAQQLSDCKLVYDRASIVAIEPFNRPSYQAKIQALLAPNTPILMVLLDYEQSQMQGPPFSVSVAEVKELYGEHYQVELLQSEQLIEIQPHWKGKGLNSLIESALSLIPIQS